MKIKPISYGKHKNKRSAGCGLCKPHKHGGEPKRRRREIERLKWMAQEVSE